LAAGGAVYGTQERVVASPGLTFAQHFANCTYSSVPDDVSAEDALCTFARPIQVGERVALTDADRRALSPLFWTHVNPYGRFELDMNRRLDLDLAIRAVPGPRTLQEEGAAVPG
jgi:hypothetical protein